jgi:hypothetical protein
MLLVSNQGSHAGPPRRVSNAASDDLDDVSVSASITDKKGAAAGDVGRLYKEAQQLLPKVVAALEQLHEELKQR